jgi:hypothetical protein
MPYFPLLLVALLLAPAGALGQGGDRPLVQVTTMAQGEAGFTEAQMTATRAVVSAVQAAGLDHGPTLTAMLFVDAVPLDGARLAVSVMVLHPLPERVIELGAEAEAFYGESLEPAEGAHVRRALTDEWLREYYSIGDHHLFTVDLDDLEAEVGAIVAGLGY